MPYRRGQGPSRHLSRSPPVTLRNVAPAKPPVEYTLPNKRVVLLHRNGMESIAGEFKPAEHTLKPFMEMPIHGMKTPFGLIKVTTRAYIYREIVEPVMKAPLKDFDPRQV